MGEEDPAAGRSELIAFRTSGCLLMVTGRELATRRGVAASSISGWLQGQVNEGRLLALPDGTYGLPGVANP